MKNLFLIFLFFILPLVTKSQCSIDSATIVNFPKNVAIRINNMARHVDISPDEQVEIGNLFLTEDSVRNSITTESSVDEEVALHEFVQAELQSVLGAERYAGLKKNEEVPFLQTDDNTDCNDQSVFLDKKLSVMQSYKSASAGMIDQITLRYDSLCMLQTGRPLVENFLEALKMTSRDKSWFAALYAQDIRENSYIAAYKDLIWYQLQAGLHSEKTDDVLQILWKRNMEANKIFFTWPESAHRNMLVTEAVAPYNEELHHLLIREGIQAPQNLFFKLVYFKRQLSLDENQVETLVEKGLAIAEDSICTGNDTLVFKSFRPFFETTLDEEQFNELLMITVLPEAREMTASCFEKIVDQQKEIPQIGRNAFKQDLFEYFLAVCLTRERFKNSPAHLEERLVILEKTQAPYYYKVFNDIPVENKRNTGTYMW